MAPQPRLRVGDRLDHMGGFKRAPAVEAHAAQNLRQRGEAMANLADRPVLALHDGKHLQRRNQAIRLARQEDLYWEAIAAERDSIARQYRDGYSDVFDVVSATLRPGFSLMEMPASDQPDAQATAAVQRLYLALLSRHADSHIVRIHGEPVAHIVMTAAQAWA